MKKEITEETKELLKKAFNAGCAFTVGGHKNFIQVNPNFNNWLKELEQKRSK